MEKKAPKLQPVNLKDLKKSPGHARRETGDIKKLKENIEKNGVVNPPVLAITKNDTLDIIDGDGRIKACLELGIESLLCLVHEELTEMDMAHLSFVLNTERADITPIEKAFHMKRMIERYGLTYTEMEALGYGSQAHISRYLDLLTLPSNTQEAIADGRLTVAHGTALLKAQNPEALTEMAIKKNWSASKITSFIKNLDEKQNQEIKPAPARGVREGADTSKIKDSSVDFICSFLDSNACDRKNRAYLEHQIAEADRVLNNGGILALIFHDAEGCASVIPCLRKKTLSFTPMTRFTAQLIPSEFEDKAKEHVKNRKHTDYKPQTESCSILIFEKAGSREIAPELAEESKLSEKEAVEYLCSGWTFEHGKTILEDIFSRLIKMYSFKEDTVIDLFSMNKAVQDVAEKLERGGFGSVKEFSDRVLKEVPEDPKATVIMPEEAKEEAEKILTKYNQA